MKCTLTVIDESVGATEELGVAGVFVCEVAEGQSAVERDPPAGRDGAAVAAAERRVDQVRDVAVLDLDVQVQVLVHAPATPAPHQHPVCAVLLAPRAQTQRKVTKKKNEKWHRGRFQVRKWRSALVLWLSPSSPPSQQLAEEKGVANAFYFYVTHRCKVTWVIEFFWHTMEVGFYGLTQSSLDAPFFIHTSHVSKSATRKRICVRYYQSAGSQNFIFGRMSNFLFIFR
jgi:hypothetical protein